MDNFDAALDALNKPKGPPSFPVVPEGYFERAVEAAASLPAEQDDSRAAKLERVVDKALGVIDDILSTPTDPYMPDGLKFIAIKKDAAIASFNLAVKVDENHFRKRSASALFAILDKITEAERQPVVLAAE